MAWHARTLHRWQQQLRPKCADFMRNRVPDAMVSNRCSYLRGCGFSTQCQSHGFYHPVSMKSSPLFTFHRARMLSIAMTKEDLYTDEDESKKTGSLSSVDISEKKPLAYQVMDKKVRIPCRLEKFLADTVGYSRKELVDLWTSQRIKVVPTPAHAAQANYSGKFMNDYVILDGDTVYLDNEPIPPPDPSKKPTCYAIYKPRDFVVKRLSLKERMNQKHEELFARQLQIDPTLSESKRQSQTIYHERLVKAINAMPVSVKPIGRLDKESEGLLLFTDSGDLNRALCTPGQVEKEYLCTFAVEEGNSFAEKGYTCDENDIRLQELLQGLYLKDGFARALQASGYRVPNFSALSASDVAKLSSRARRLRKRGKKGDLRLWEVSITINEGRNRIIRRMVGSAGFGRLRSLVRTRFGPIALTSDQENTKNQDHLSLETKTPVIGISLVRSGSSCKLGSKEVDALWDAAGGIDQVRNLQVTALASFAQRMKNLERPLPLIENWISEHCQLE